MVNTLPESGLDNNINVQGKRSLKFTKRFLDLLSNENVRTLTNIGHRYIKLNVN